MLCDLKKLFLSITAMAALVGCQASQTGGVLSPTVVTAQEGRENDFRENLSAIQPNLDVEKISLDIVSNYRSAFNESDISSIEKLLSEDFEVRHIGFSIDSGQFFTPTDGTLVARKEDRRSYLNRRSVWSVNSPRDEELLLNIRSINTNEQKTEVAIETGSTYKSTHFNPRYIQIFIIRKYKEMWKLSKIYRIDSQPASNEVKVSLISLAKITPLGPKDDIQTLIDKNGPNVIFDQFLEPICCIQESRNPLLIVFAEPPSEGANVTIRERAFGHSKIYTTDSVFSRVSPYTFFTGYGWYNSSLTVEVEVLIDGTVVAREQL